VVNVRGMTHDKVGNFSQGCQLRQVVGAAGCRYYELSGRVNQLEEWKTERPGDLPAGVIAVQIRAGGAGVDLTRACYCVYYSLGFSFVVSHIVDGMKLEAVQGSRR